MKIDRHGLRWREFLGLLVGAYAGAAALAKRTKRLLIFDAPRAGVTVVIARGERRQQVRDRLVDFIEPDAVPDFGPDDRLSTGHDFMEGERARVCTHPRACDEIGGSCTYSDCPCADPSWRA